MKTSLGRCEKNSCQAKAPAPPVCNAFTNGVGQTLSSVNPALPILAIVAAACLATGCQRAESNEKALTPVKTKAVELLNQFDELRYSANVEPNTRVDVAFRVGGYVDHIRQVAGADGRERDLQDGDFVSKGTVLASLRQVDYTVKTDQARAQLGEARAMLESAQSQLLEAQAGAQKASLDFARAQNLFSSQSLTKPDYDAAKAQQDTSSAKVNTAKDQIETAQSRVNEAQAALGNAELSQQDTELKAPLDGVVMKRNIETGALVSAGTAAFSMADLTTVKVVFGASDVVMPRLKLGASLPVRTEAIPDAVFQGRVTRISPAADPKSRVFEVEVAVPNAANRLKAGMIATVVVGESGRPVELPVLPLNAVIRSKNKPDGYAVFVVRDEGGKQVAHMRDVQLGQAFGNSIGVVSGVQLGDRVVTNGSNLVRDGETVQVVP
ncbi:MAG: efflux RND transporter periplasmic adaptor subunit [Bryobacteraceae bacterium]|jgi:multidrug efflux system membrane fusion protein